jgi:hypothetical protein
VSDLKPIKIDIDHKIKAKSSEQMGLNQWVVDVDHLHIFFSISFGFTVLFLLVYLFFAYNPS